MACDECRGLWPPKGGRAEEHKHPDCRYCLESTRVNVGLITENKQLRGKLAELRDEVERLSRERKSADNSGGDGQ